MLLLFVIMLGYIGCKRRRGGLLSETCNVHVHHVLLLATYIVTMDLCVCYELDIVWIDY